MKSIEIQLNISEDFRKFYSVFSLRLETNVYIWEKNMARSVFAYSELDLTDLLLCCVDLREITVLWCFTDYAEYKPKYLLWKQLFLLFESLYKPCWWKTNSILLETLLSYTEELEHKDTHTNRWVVVPYTFSTQNCCMSNTYQTH